ncbi:LysR substrate-binding domain-containing protein [Marinobacterium rhizophilum]|uniref:LysR family transcriptional regulator n=1 Tax=Marinobacterium rhizophilum TaxID=420402 RepID=A0ABY5HEA3_9GAMM|nr:LysR substrate-binding domain-containing protein [Marinobacterium rhizophilum]UTW10681.1 LysR family transcriptional regulator [Marinobacterium rhizophilum]
MKIKPLPPLNSLVAFESAARHLSFTQAAIELSVTQGAISRQIRHLEEYLGRGLFVRDKRQLTLTQTGAEYYDSVQQSLLLISSATGAIVQWQGNQQLTVVTSNAMASLWLLPRLPEFQDLHPDIDVRILATDSLQGLRNSEFDVALFYCRTPPTGLQATPLFKERVFPVCSPAFLARHSASETGEGEPEDILSTTQLWLDSAEDWLNWSQWFSSAGLPPQEPRRRLNLNNYPMLVQAALNGQGIALGWEQLVTDYLKSGLLVRPVAVELNTTARFYMLEPEEPMRRKPGVEVFRHWLLQHVGECEDVDAAIEASRTG